MSALNGLLEGAQASACNMRTSRFVTREAVAIHSDNLTIGAMIT